MEKRNTQELLQLADMSQHLTENHYSNLACELLEFEPETINQFKKIFEYRLNIVFLKMKEFDYNIKINNLNTSEEHTLDNQIKGIKLLDQYKEFKCLKSEIALLLKISKLVVTSNVYSKFEIEFNYIIKSASEYFRINKPASSIDANLLRLRQFFCNFNLILPQKR